MKKSITTLFLAIGAILSSEAVIHPIKVGEGGFKFTPSTLAVAVGDTVRFVYVAGFHTTESVQIPAGALAWDAPIQNSGQKFDYPVLVPGTYSYKCGPHVGLGMTGSFSATVTGLKSEDAMIKNSFSIAPNPSIDQSSLQFNASHAFNGAIRVFDAAGAVVNNQKIQVLAGENTFVVATAQLLSGLYYVHVVDEEKSVAVSKLIKQ